MAIDVSYGPISGALGLARQAGLAKRKQIVGQQDLDFLGMMQNAQSKADSDYANQVQQAIGVKEFNARMGMDSQQAAAERQMAQQRQNFTMYDQNRDAAIRQQSVNQQGQLGQSRVDIGQANQQLATQKHQERQDAISQLPPELQNIVQSTGRMPYIPNSIGQGQNNDFKALESEYSRLRSDATREQAQQQRFMVPKNDLTAEPSQQFPGVNKSFEPQYQESQARLQTIKARQAQIEQSLTSHVNGLMEPGHDPNGDVSKRVMEYLGALNRGGGSSKDAGQGSSQPQDNNGGQTQTSQDGTPVVKTAQDYAQLPPGTVYINGNTGQRAQKP